MAVQKSTQTIIIALLVASLFNGVAWAAMIPMWHTPDEQAHFAQAQDIAAIGYRPNPGLSTPEDIVIAEKFLGTYRDSRGNNRFTYHPEYRIPYTNSTGGLYEHELVGLPVELRTVFTAQEATGYPPMYYWVIAAVNRSIWRSDLITRVFLSRVATVLITAAGTLVVYVLAKEVFLSQVIAITAATLVAFHPMWRFVGSGVTSDTLFNILYPLLLLVVVKFIANPSFRLLCTFLLTSVLALATKLQAVILVVISEPFILTACIRKGKRPGMLERRSAILLVAITALLFLGAFLENSIEQLTPTEQFLLSFIRLPELGRLLEMPAHPTFGEYIRSIGVELYRQTFPWYWGVYRWLSLTIPLWVYRIIKIVILGSIIGMVAGVWRRSFGSLVRKIPLLLLIVSSLTYATGLLLWNFFYWKSHGFSLGIQGRYFFPNLPEHMIFLLTGLVLLVPVKMRRVVAFICSVAMIFFNWYSLWFVSTSYYDSSNWKMFFLQASQYKPWFFKFPFLPGWLVVSMLSAVVFLMLLGYHVRKSHAR